MTVQVREKTIEDIQEKLEVIQTELSKINYLESVLKEPGFSFEIKRFIYGQLGSLYETKKMYGKAAKAFEKKAEIEITFKDKSNSYITSAENYCRTGKVDIADDMFARARRDTNKIQQNTINLAQKNLYQVMAQNLENKGRKASAVKFYEKLIEIPIGEDEKKIIKEKMKKTYEALGLFREARLLEGI